MAPKPRFKTAPLLAPLLAAALVSGWLWHSETADEQAQKPSPQAAHTASSGPAVQASKPGNPEAVAPSGGAPIETMNVSRWQAGTAWGLEPDPACRAFSAWAETYSAAAPARRADLEAQGIKLASARRAALKDLISRDPQAALAAAVPAAIRLGMPPAVTAQLEERVSGMGGIKLLAVRPRAGDLEAAPYRRSVSIGERSYGGFVFGERENEGSTARDSLHGIAVDDRLALAESRLRLLEPGESPDPTKPVVLDLLGAHAVSEPAPVVLESGEGVVHGCCRRDLAAVERKWVLASGGPVPSGGGPNATPYRSTGSRSVLVLLVRMADGPSMLTQAQAQTGIDQVTTWLNQSSFQQLNFNVRTVTPELTLPQTKAQYLALGESGASGDGPSTLLADARAAAAALGASYDSANFDFDVVVFEETFNFAGLGTVGGKGNWIQIGTVGQFETSTTAHEFGHNLGLNHAGCWVRPAGSLNTIDPAGTFRDYGSIFDALGLGGYPRGQYSAHYKKLLGWIPPANVHTISAPTAAAGVRIYAHDAGVAIDPARHYGIRVNVADHVGAGIRDYWMDVRTLFTDRPSSQNGVTLQWGDQIGSPQGSCLLDTTPTPNTVGGYSVLDDFVDAPLALNSTFTDSACGITLTPVATGGSGADKWVDVSVTTPDADLTALSLSVGSLSPAFSSSTLDYTASVPSGTTSLTVTPTASSASATLQVRVNGGAFTNVTTGTASGALALVPGPNLLEIKVTAAGGLWSKTYRTRVSTIPVVAGTGYGEIPDGLSGFPSPGAPRDITFTVSGRTGAITDVLVEFTLQPAHAYCSDVAVVLIAPDSTQHTVCALGHLDDDSRMAGPYLFSDAAAVPFSLAVTAAGGNVDVPSGSYRTQNDSDTATSLAAFFASKAPNGTWTLRFTDRYAGDTGSVSAANLYIATASDDANLSALTLSSAVLAPTFNANAVVYSANVPNATASIMVTPTVAQAGATVMVNSVTVASGSASAPLALNVGSNTITVLVTAQNGTTTKSYTLTVTRAAPSGGGEIVGTNLGEIPYETPAGRNIDFDVAGRTGTVTGVTVQFTLNPAHTYASDLSVMLIAPDGTVAQIFNMGLEADDESDLGGPYLFQDSATGYLSVAAATVGDSPVAAGAYRAEDAGTPVVLNAVFGGKAPNGPWTLKFIDAYPTDTGTVSDARLNLTTSGGAPATQPKIAMVRQPNGNRLLTLTEALPNASYHLQRSTNLTAWPNLTTVTTSSAGIAIYTDTTAAAPSYFYRFVSVSP